MISTGLREPVRLTKIKFFPFFTFTPASTNFSIIALKCSTLTFLIVTSPFDRAAAIAKVTASMRSGIISYLAPDRYFTPFISILGEPWPLIFAPILFKKLAKSTVSGSQAAFSIIVVAGVRVAAIITFAVANTEEPNEPPKKICLPLSLFACAQT